MTTLSTYCQQCIARITPIARIDTFSCLRVNIDEQLSWGSHIDHKCSKVGAGIGLIRRINVPSVELLANLQWTSLETKRINSKLLFVYKTNLSVSLYFSRLSLHLASCGRRRRRRARRREK